MIYEFVSSLIPVKTILKERSDGDFQVLSNRTFEVHYLNCVAKDFFGLVDGKRTVQEIVASLLQEYNVVKDVLEQDILCLVRELQWKKILSLKEAK